MHAFKDKTGRSWEVHIDVTAVKRVRALVGVDLLEIVEGKLIETMIRDPILLVDIVYAVCKPTADGMGVSDEDFGKAMAGDAIEGATTALLEDLVDFFPSPRDRANLGKVLKATNRLMDRARDLVDQKIEDGELDRVIEQALATAGDSSAGAPESSASIRAP